MNSATSTVTELWNFLIPPRFKVAIVIALTAWLARPLLVGAISYLKKTAERSRGEVETEPLLKTLGLEKLIPGVVLFLFVLLIYAGNELILRFGWRLPFDITTSQPASLLHLTSEKQLLTLWSRHPDVEFSDLPLALENDLLRLTVSHTPDILSNVEHWERTSAATKRWFYTLKFLMAYSVLLCIVAIRRAWHPKRTIWRTFLSILIIAVALSLLTARLLFCYAQLLQAKYHVIVATLPVKQLERAEMERLKERLKNAEMIRGYNSWWRIEIFDTYSWMQGVKYLAGSSIYGELRKFNKAEPPGGL